VRTWRWSKSFFFYKAGLMFSDQGWSVQKLYKLLHERIDSSVCSLNWWWLQQTFPQTLQISLLFVYLIMVFFHTSEFFGGFYMVFRYFWCPECNTLTLWSTRSHGIEKISRHHLMIKTSLIGFFSVLIHYLPAASSTCADKNYDLIFCAGLLCLH
jgi:hypothetical protein